jgi:hypothetical protein
LTTSKIITNSKPTKATAKKAKEPVAKAKVPTLLELLQENSKARKEVALDFFITKTTAVSL